MRRALWPLTAVAVLLVSACSSVPQELVDAEALACPSGSPCYDPPSPRGPGGELVVEGGEFFFEVVSGEAQEGPVRISFRNVGSAEHNITIDEAYGDVKQVPPSGNLAGGQTAEGTLQLFAGSYTIYCSVPGHRSAGMEATIDVALPSEDVAPAPGPTGAGPSPEATVTAGAQPGEGGPSPEATGKGGPPEVPQQTASPSP